MEYLLYKLTAVLVLDEVFDGQTAAWNANGNYGMYWSSGSKNSASVDNDMDII